MTARARIQQDPDDAYAGGEDSSGESSGACKYTDFKDITAVIRQRQGIGGSYFA